MQNFAEQCMDMARVILARNLDAIKDDGSIEPAFGESSRSEDSGYATLALGEFFRATQETKIGQFDIFNLASHCVTAQVNYQEEDSESGLALASLGLLSFGPSKDRNSVWSLLSQETQELIDKRLLIRSDYTDHRQAFNIGKAVTRYSLGLSKRDETGKLIERFVERIKSNSSGGFCDDLPRPTETPSDILGGCFDITGVMQYVFIRQSLQLHANIHLRERKLPTLRTYAEKYLKLIPEIVREDGLGWCFGKETGAYGQMHLISIILQSMRDKWIPNDKLPLYKDILKKLFIFFFVTYLDQENGILVIRDGERDTNLTQTSRAANFNAARYLCQWSRLAKTIGGTLDGVSNVPTKPICRFISCDKTPRKEQGILIYQDPKSKLHIQIPLISGGRDVNSSDSLAAPHMPGIFDFPVNKYVPAFIPEFTIGENTFIPAYYGKNVHISIGLKNAFCCSYEQPELITKDEKIIPGVGSCKTEWEFSGGKITVKYTLQVKQATTLDKMRFIMPIATCHSSHHLGNSFRLGEKSLGCTVPKDDFQGTWLDYENVSAEPEHRTRYGKVYYYQTFTRAHAMTLKPGMPYRIEISYEPDIATIE